MPDPISGADATKADATVVTPPNGGAPADNGGAKPEGKPADSGDQKPKDATDEGADKGKDDGKGEFVDDKGEPPVNQRKTAKDYIIQRKNAKIAKLKKAKQEGKDAPKGDESDDKGDDPEEGAEPLDGEPDDDMPPSLEGLKPIVEEHIAAQDAKEIDEFLSKNPDLAKFRAKVERWMKHPTRRNLPVKAIFAEVAFDDLMKIGADRAREADAKAKESQAGGGSNRDATSPIDWRTATKEQLEAEQMRVRLGKK